MPIYKAIMNFETVDCFLGADSEEEARRKFRRMILNAIECNESKIEITELSGEEVDSLPDYLAALPADRIDIISCRSADEG